MSRGASAPAACSPGELPPLAHVARGHSEEQSTLLAALWIASLAMTKLDHRV